MFSPLTSGGNVHLPTNDLDSLISVSFYKWLIALSHKVKWFKKIKELIPNTMISFYR